MPAHISMRAQMIFWWDDDHKLWRIQWRDAQRRPMGGLMKIDSAAPLDGWARRQIAMKVSEHFYSDLAGIWRD